MIKTTHTETAPTRGVAVRSGYSRERRRVPHPRRRLPSASAARCVPARIATPSKAQAASPTGHSESLARHVLTAIRIAMGVLFVVCGFGGLYGVLPHAHVQASMQGSAVALGSAIVLAGSMLPLLKGVEVIVAALLDLYQNATASHE
jgi:hypothetical protein